MESKARATRNIGIPWVAPPSRGCDDDSCPWHGTASVRGRTLIGEVRSVKAGRMAVVQRTYYYYQPKYIRYERRRSVVHAYVPPCVDVREGDRIVIGETRPITKTVSFVVLGRIGGGRR